IWWPRLLNLPFLSLLFLDLPLFFLSSQYQKVKWFIPFARSCYLIFQPVYHTTNPPSSYSFSTQPHSVYSSGLSLPAHHTALSEVNSVYDPLPPRNNPAIFRSSREDKSTARGVFNSSGGVLSSTETRVSIFIPQGAIPERIEQEIYFKVCRGNSILPPLDKEKGEKLLSHLVMCGPHGLKFLKPVELCLPYSCKCKFRNHKKYQLNHFFKIF
uniref:ZU5 domain-containing protein n=1 Tax=Accipiter nisus TaxID=211598 RepID=A0A8B9MWN5_9AVES